MGAKQGTKIDEEPGSGAERLLQDPSMRARSQETPWQQQREREPSKAQHLGRCWGCGSTRHTRCRCPKMVYFRCGSRGHIKAGCPRKDRSESREEKAQPGVTGACLQQKNGMKQSDQRLWESESDEEMKTARAWRADLGSATKKAARHWVGMLLRRRSRARRIPQRPAGMIS